MIFLAAELSDVLFIMLINVKMPTDVGILKFWAWWIKCLVEISINKSFIISKTYMSLWKQVEYWQMIVSPFMNVYVKASITFTRG